MTVLSTAHLCRSLDWVPPFKLDSEVGYVASMFSKTALTKHLSDLVWFVLENGWYVIVKNAWAIYSLCVYVSQYEKYAG